MQCGDVDAAERAFGKLTEKTQYTFGAMIKGWTVVPNEYAQCSTFACRIFDQ